MNDPEVWRARFFLVLYLCFLAWVGFAVQTAVQKHAKHRFLTALPPLGAATIIIYSMLRYLRVITYSSDRAYFMKDWALGVVAYYTMVLTIPFLLGNLISMIHRHYQSRR